ncbi:hypothetical protein B0T25DRAFT_32047 [Lasiosphaeria hispida]|uniref:C2H2-type domain-containing protein n=1 Tax=Lasiosphaeria hispida TaxID=260671 RepID=A0AAJ0MJY1_9PEZI|nr:hypothetical protein B0T25DRAFT_32047 [Lasiosphaeria hispida]
MDLDFDLDSLAWADDLDRSTSPANVEMGIDIDIRDPPSAHPLPFGTGAVFPLDYLFAEDEAAFSTPFVGTTSHMDAPSLAHFGVRVDDQTPQRLRDQLSLLSEGSFGDEIVFKNCDSSKAALLYSLTVDLGLSFSREASAGTVSVTRATPPAVLPFRQKSTPVFPSQSFIEHDWIKGSMGGVASSAMTISSKISDDSAGHQSIGTTSSDTCTISTAVRDDQQLSRRPSRSQRISDSISKHVSTWKTSMTKSGGRRGPLTEDGRRDMKVLEGAGGACWRCKVLRRKCDPGIPCRCCLQSVPMPMPYLGEDAPLWPLIGCRRGPLRNALPSQVLCPGFRPTSRIQASAIADTCQPRRSLDIADRVLLSAESQRLADMKAVLERASYKLSITDPAMKQCFVSFIETGRYRNQECLHQNLTLEDESVSYTELIATIAWELSENQALLPLLEIRSWDGFMAMLETACIYESEVGHTSLVMLSMICLRRCFEALRLHSADLLSVKAHSECGPGQCQVQCVQDIHRYVATYIDELSSVVFNKENMKDRRWWLSTFYSLYIQSYVRHALIAIEKYLCFEGLDDVPAEDLANTQYLHLAAVLFTAASAKYDPLLGGRLQYALTENSVIPETSVPELHHSSARVVCEVEKWPEVGIKTSYQFLRRLLQIGSLDFEEEQVETESIGVSSAQETVPSPNQPLPSPQSLKSPSSIPLSPRDPTSSVTSPSYQFDHRWSAGTRYSKWTASTFSGNESSESLARTFHSDITSIYELPLPPIPSQGGESSIESPLQSESNPKPALPPLLEHISHSTTEYTSTGVSSACFVCHCCPRAPQRFKTAEELTQHEAEKPYPCAQCRKRFKSPTEADRHRNAVHIKSDYWTCGALENPLVAFQRETHEERVWEVCGFCGGGFAQETEASAARDESHTSELLVHLESVHHHGECSREKKFYRVDNFRQHLKTTHVARQGNWLKILEGKCRTTKGGGDPGVVES